ncbi:MAG TPA: glycoside hydrolase family 43 protein [Clostridiales bacterium]|nr:glycoside hydrolase family 43 protein [Clostridiales bacterium]
MAYLFSYFSSAESGDLEKIWFAVSRDGLHWQDINNKEPIIESTLGTKGIRDPFIVYDDKTKKYYMLATDLETSEGNWGEYVKTGSRSIRIWDSEDLINWSDERLVEVAVENAGCAWAPEAVFCKEKDSWFVFWASCVKEEDDENPKQRIYGAFTDDFITFSPTFKFIDKEVDVIDTNIVWSNGYYYRISKDETIKAIMIERSPVLIPENIDDWEVVEAEVPNNFLGLEGPEVYYLREQKKWCLIADQYWGNKGYLPMVTDDLGSGDFRVLNPDEYDFGELKKRHGGVIEIPDELYSILLKL